MGSHPFDDSSAGLGRDGGPIVQALVHMRRGKTSLRWHARPPPRSDKMVTRSVRVMGTWPFLFLRNQRAPPEPTFTIIYRHSSPPPPPRRPTSNRVEYMIVIPPPDPPPTTHVSIISAPFPKTPIRQHGRRVDFRDTTRISAFSHPPYQPITSTRTAVELPVVLVHYILYSSITYLTSSPFSCRLFSRGIGGTFPTHALMRDPPTLTVHEPQSPLCDVVDGSSIAGGGE